MKNYRCMEDLKVTPIQRWQVSKCNLVWSGLNIGQIFTIQSTPNCQIDIGPKQIHIGTKQSKIFWAKPVLNWSENDLISVSLPKW